MICPCQEDKKKFYAEKISVTEICYYIFITFDYNFSMNFRTPLCVCKNIRKREMIIYIYQVYRRPKTLFVSIPPAKISLSPARAQSERNLILSDLKDKCGKSRAVERWRRRDLGDTHHRRNCDGGFQSGRENAG